MTKTTSSEFKPEDHLIDIKGKKYLTVAWRLVWFRKDCPSWRIKTEVVELFKGEDGEASKGVLMKAKVYDETGILMATAHKSETKVGFSDFIEKAETGAIGRALAMCGFGTQFAPDLEEGERIVDAPVKKKPAKPKTNYEKRAKEAVSTDSIDMDKLDIEA